MNLIKSNLQREQIRVKRRLSKPFFDIFFNPYFADCTYYLITGGNSSGKSYSTADYFLYRLMNFKNLYDVMMREHLTHIYDSQFKLIQNHIYAMELEKYFEMTQNRSGPYIITYKPTKSTIVGKGLCAEHDIMSFTNLTGAWLEEASQFRREYVHKFFTQARKKGYPIKFFLTLNPVSKQNYTYTDFVSKHYKQLPESIPVKWYDTITDRDGNQRSVATAALRTTYLDNLPNLDDIAIYNIEKYKTVMPDYYEVYGLGMFGSLGEGIIFKREYRKHYPIDFQFPSDCAGFIYCDPNHAPKGKGDTTAIVNLYFSERKKTAYIKDYRCFNCTNPNELITAILSMIDRKTEVIGFDGHRGQEAQWTHNFNMYAEANGFPAGVSEMIQYKRYIVNNLAKNAQFHYNNGSLLFPERMGTDGDEEGELFLDQFHSFAGKKEGNHKTKDDAPDALICALELAFENNYMFDN